VTLDGRPLERLNELEWIKGEVWANVWQTDMIVRIDPSSGQVIGVLDMTGLLGQNRRDDDDVLNGIAYDAETDRTFVSGKRWPLLFEIHPQ
jgi:glutamine cyclotransferase